MARLFLYKIRSMLGNPGQLFWVLVFPILLGTLFYFTFGTLLNEDITAEEINVAAVEKSPNPHFEEMLRTLSESEDKLLNVEYLNEKGAVEKLKNGNAAGIFYISEKPSLTVESNGIEQTILANILNRYAATEEAVKDIIETDPDITAEKIKEITAGEDFVNNIDLNTTVNSIWRENFYALIAMTCLYGGFFALTAAAELKAGESSVGVRLQISPVPKSKLVIADCAAMTLTVFAIVLALLLYMNFALKIDLGANAAQIAMTCLAGSFCGVMIGMFVGSALNISKGAKEAILIGVSLGLCFLSGLMYPGMRLLIEHNAPVINRINPAALIVDSLYSLDAYGVDARFYADITLLTGIGVIFATLSVIALRRKKYADS